MDKKELSWSQLIHSIQIHRDVRARYFKPTCIVAACNFLDTRGDSIESIPAIEIINEFEKLVLPLIPAKATSGWMPLWHLMTDGAWICKKSGVPTDRKIFPLNKPKTFNQLINAVDTLDCSGPYSILWADAKARNQLRSMMNMLMLADKNPEVYLLGEYLKSKQEFSDEKLDLATKVNSSNDLDTVVEEYARYGVHKRIERDKKISKEVKQRQGFTCLACGFNFEKIFGPIGRGYIEAHHVLPISKAADKKREVNFFKDFLVLCSNCHRMIHRLGEPWSISRLDDLKNLLSKKNNSNH